MGKALISTNQGLGLGRCWCGDFAAKLLQCPLGGFALGAFWRQTGGGFPRSLRCCIMAEQSRNVTSFQCDGRVIRRALDRLPNIHLGASKVACPACERCG